jgi:branched-chain amino acid aminotransferase
MIEVIKSPESKIEEVDFENLIFGKTFSDHMFQAKYIHGAWTKPTILPYGPISLSPGAAVFHYGQAFFEGMKAYKNPSGEVYLFRPRENWIRFNKSAERLLMPQVSEDMFIQALRQLVSIEREWVKSGFKNSLYIRPVMFGEGVQVAARPAEEFTFMVLTCPVNMYYPHPVKVKVEEEYSRSAPGGTGYAKAAGNYAGAFYPTHLAQKQGYNQLIWTDACTHEYIEESGTMNLMLVMDGKLVTPTVSPTILKGVTRDSLLQLARHLGIETEERRVSVAEMVEGLQNGRVTEMFGVGTAAIVSPISAVGFRGTDYELPAVEAPMYEKLKHTLLEIQHGLTEDPFGWRMLIS